MAQRTDIIPVQKLLSINWDGESDVQPYIDTASVIVDRTVTEASYKGFTLTTQEQELIERWLSCHFYTKMDPLYTSKSTGGASGSFISGKDEPERYRDGAINLDISGALKEILCRQTATGFALNRC